jgi:aspartyl-tRNA(Asn)/glutamyl-tRNA(Gln) amidotransferase subunit C
MQVDEALVRHIARLARMKIEDEQVKPLERELTAILGWVEQLNGIDTSGVAPLSGAAAMKMALRADVVTDGGYPEDIVRNAPLSEDNFFVVPKVVE